jgi:heme/copper-type cytochrome/quinol oxidase subunit 2
MMNFGNSSFPLIGLLIFIADIWAILNIAQSSSENLKKAIWIAIIVFLPVLGLVLWFLFGPRGGRT